MGSTLSSINLETIQQFVDSLSSKEQFKLKFKSDKSDFTESFGSPIYLNPNRKYEFALKRFSVYNTLFNITSENNNFFI
jgi:hypothetical protein